MASARRRKARSLQRKFTVYCEGETEKHYLTGLKRWFGAEYPDVRLTIEAISVHGGGYIEFVKRLKCEPDSNCLARFVMLDYDRCKHHPSERDAFRSLIKISQDSRKRRIPVILIVSNNSFEYPLCCHDPEYHDGDEVRFLCKAWGYRDLDAAKADEKIWEAAHRGKRSHECALRRLAQKPRLITNEIVRSRSEPTIKLKDTELNLDHETGKSSNLYDLFYAVGAVDL